MADDEAESSSLSKRKNILKLFKKKTRIMSFLVKNLETSILIYGQIKMFIEAVIGY